MNKDTVNISLSAEQFRLLVSKLIYTGCPNGIGIDVVCSGGIQDGAQCTRCWRSALMRNGTEDTDGDSDE